MHFGLEPVKTSFFLKPLVFQGIATAAIEHVAGKESLSTCRKPEIMSDAAAAILKRKTTGNFYIDDEVLLSEGLSQKDLEKYAVSPGAPLMPDFFLDDVVPPAKL
jgi:citronellol/citronellal dehydrogenase